MATPLLYHVDPLIFDFEAEVVAVEAAADRTAVILVKTAFYPEGGGQLADRGSLDGREVLDVQVDEAGIVRHWLAGAAAPSGVVRGSIDRRRRRQFMALHTAQHMLSRALLDEAGGETVSARLGENISTIDLDLTDVAEGAVQKAQDLVNAVIEDDVAIRAFFPTPDELASLPLRRRPKVSENVRVVAVGEFDVSPCGGTHCTSSAEIGVVDVVGIERYKGKIRVSFLAGRLAREQLRREARELRGLGRQFTCGPLDVAASVAKQSADLKELKERTKRLAEPAAKAIAEDLVARTPAGAPLIAVVPDADVDLLRGVSSAAIARGAPVVVVGVPGGPIVVERGAASAIDAGALVRKITGGKGGGRKERAEGRLAPDIDLVSAARAALEA